MKKTRIEKLDIDVYKDELENGLQIYLIPLLKGNNIYTTFTAKYGSNIIEFIPNGEDKYYKSPYGVAHFLEHKLFEQKSGEDPFSFYAKNGASNNAYTNFFYTSYLFSGPNNFKNNLEYLLDFVQEPYFTDENVEKEKGIIIQELKMYRDSCYRRGFEQIIKNSFSLHPVRIPTIGTIESINSITKEDLNKCYNTFYNPNNMILTITGNIDVEETLNIIKNNQANKKFLPKNDIKIKEYNEPNKVNKKEDIIYMNVSIPKIFVGFKIKKDKIKSKKQTLYLNLYLDSKLGPTSEFSEYLKNKQIINTDLDYTIIDAGKHYEIIVIADTKEYEILKKGLIKELNNKNILEKEFNRKKKCYLSTFIGNSDNIFYLNKKIVNDLILYDELDLNIYNLYNELNYNEFLTYINDLNLENNTSVIIKSNTCQN